MKIDVTFISFLELTVHRDDDQHNKHIINNEARKEFMRTLDLHRTQSTRVQQNISTVTTSRFTSDKVLQQVW